MKVPIKAAIIASLPHGAAPVFTMASGLVQKLILTIITKGTIATGIATATGIEMMITAEIMCPTEMIPTLQEEVDK